MISIILRTFNETEQLAETLHQIKIQNIDMPYEVIFVDSGSRPDTLSLIETFLETCKGKLLHMKKADFSYGGSLNYGIESTNSEKVVLLSSHCPPVDAAWLKTLATALEEKRASAVYGKQVSRRGVNPFDERMQKRMFGDAERELTRPKQACHFSSANCLIRREIWERERFREDLPYAEDFHWAIRILKAGKKILYTPKAAVFHSHPPTLHRAYLQSYRARCAFKMMEREGIVIKNSKFKLSDVATDFRNILMSGQSIFFWRYFPYRFFQLLGRTYALICAFRKTNVR